MKRFAQIHEGRIHAILDSEERPEFAPYIELVEITDRHPSPQEGWLYQQGAFAAPPSPPDDAWQAQVSNEMASLRRQLAGIYVYRLNRGESLPEHQHEIRHAGILLKGGGTLTRNDTPLSIASPFITFFSANERHGFTATEDRSIWMGVFPDQLG